MARLGSGSASRSTQIGWGVWGENNFITDSSDHHAVFLDSSIINFNFRKLNNAICLVSKKQKATSSSLGHDLMKNHPYKNDRIKQANQNLGLCLDSLRSGDWELFSNVVEEEALGLHGLMMSGERGYTLLEEASWVLIEKIRALRNQGYRVCFSIDAGPNIHLIYDPKEQEVLKYLELWKSELGIDYISSGVLDE